MFQILMESRWGILRKDTRMRGDTIDTRGTVDGLRCLECKCELYNVTVDGLGYPINSEYIGGIRCCFDDVKCRLKDGYRNDVKKKVYYMMKYTVTYLDWNPSIVPVKIYILDVSDTLRWRESLQRHHCWVSHFSLFFLLFLFSQENDDYERMETIKNKKGSLDTDLVNII
nr:uncharacterized protein LOC109169218 [Ipomoea batatas]